MGKRELGRRDVLALSAGAALAGVSGRAAQAAEPVDLRLVLAADVSRSVDQREFQLQREGYAAALTDVRVVRALTSGPLRRVAVTFMEWSGVTAQQVIVDWSVIGDDETAADVAARILAAPRPFADRTAIGAALEVSIGMIRRCPHPAPRSVIDVSGDGTNTNGPDPRVVREAAVAAGITINGLVILSPEPIPWNPYHTHPPGGLDEWYRQNVAAGPGAFVMPVENFETFGFALVSKLLREVS